MLMGWMLLLARGTLAAQQLPQPHLSIVIPCYNSRTSVVVLLKSIFAKLRSQIRHLQVIVVDDHSTDGLDEAMEEFLNDAPSENFVLLRSDESLRGAGHARNSAIPFLSAQYTYFIDADDSVDANALWAAVSFARKKNADLLFLPYTRNYGDLQMSGKDNKLWTNALNWQKRYLPRDAYLRYMKVNAFQLTNYPWNRLIRTKLLQDKQVYFAPTPVQNDVQFHWKSIALAQSIEFFDKPVCVHRYSKASNQLTNIKSKDRVALIDALRLTDILLQECCAFHEADPRFIQLWFGLVHHLLDWAGKWKVPRSCKRLYNHRAAKLHGNLNKGVYESQRGFLPESPDFLNSPEYKAAEKSCAGVKRYGEADLLLRAQGSVAARGRAQITLDSELNSLFVTLALGGALSTSVLCLLLCFLCRRRLRCVTIQGTA